eukprot:Pgem_evm1s1803
MHPFLIQIARSFLGRNSIVRGTEYFLLPLAMTVGFIGYQAEQYIREDQDLDARKSAADIREEKELEMLTELLAKRNQNK